MRPADLRVVAGRPVRLHAPARHQLASPTREESPRTLLLLIMLAAVVEALVIWRLEWLPW